MDVFEHAAAVVREHSPDRFVSDLFAPQPARGRLLALHAFDAEIARIRFAVSEPALGEIRMQWWRDAIAGGEGGGNPLAEALLQTIEAVRLPRPAFDALIEARIFDLYNDPMPTLADFEGYAGETASAVVHLGALILTGGADVGAADASGHTGVALSLRDALLRFGADARRRQLLLPRDRFAALGVGVDAIFAARDTPALREALADLRAAARDHLARAIAALRNLPNEVAPAFLALALVASDLDRLDTAAPFDPPRLMPLWRRQLRIRRAARRGLSPNP
jgi:phytoene synthase